MAKAGDNSAFVTYRQNTELEFIVQVLMSESLMYQQLNFGVVL